jgi:hypothetical protein
MIKIAPKYGTLDIGPLTSATAMPYQRRNTHRNKAEINKNEQME